MCFRLRHKHCIVWLEQFLFLAQYGRNALEIVMKSIVNLDSPMVSPPFDFPGDFFKGKYNSLDAVAAF